jgi:riboflavin kinase / FMN adenylyltransferase
MIVHSGFEDWNLTGGSVASLGNYDGVHLGHQAILKAVTKRAKELSVPSVAVTFHPIPKKVLHPENAPLLIQTIQQRLNKIEKTGIEHVVMIRFDHSFASLAPENFVLDYLVRKLQIKGFVVGENFSFGHQKKGNIRLLREIGGQFAFFVEAIPEIRKNAARISSTLIRQLVREGKIEEANELLGDPFTLAGTVVEGEKLGGKLGIPTANLEVENELIPGNGVYIGRTLISKGTIPSVMNVGVRPTVGGRKLTVESHLLNYSGNLYGDHIELQFLSRLRDEIRFNSVDELKTRIHADIDQAHQYFAKA